jgi:hypothetical protein
VTAVEHVYPLVRSQKQLDRVLDEIDPLASITAGARLMLKAKTLEDGSGS